MMLIPGTSRQLGRSNLPLGSNWDLGKMWFSMRNTSAWGDGGWGERRRKREFIQISFLHIWSIFLTFHTIVFWLISDLHIHTDVAYEIARKRFAHEFPVTVPLNILVMAGHVQKQTLQSTTILIWASRLRMRTANECGLKTQKIRFHEFTQLAQTQIFN